LIVTKLELPGVLALDLQRYRDSRGFFVELFNAAGYGDLGVRGPFVQDNFSRSKRGVLRGLHLQNPNSQSKLVCVMNGSVLDIVVDVRVGSPTFGRHLAIELSEENGRQLFVPAGFAHGFIVLSETADFFYKCDAIYSPNDELVVRWNDPALGIDWRIATPTLSPRDAEAPLLKDIANLPVFRK
jgi:dTDP-4-dehydrorhamnose 3,5-epimerase